jgi:hypothetical protein
VHSLSQVFTGAIYDILADIFLHERIKQSKAKEPTQILFEVAQHLRKLLLDAIIAAPASGATFANVADEMIKKSKLQGDPVIYRTFIKNRFIVREVVVSAVPLTKFAQSVAMTDYANAKFMGTEGEVTELIGTDHVSSTPGVPQDRSGCCGTMQLPEYARPEKVLSAELKRLAEGEDIDKDLTLLATELKDLEKTFA